MFDVTIESFDLAEICEYDSCYIIDKLSVLLCKQNVGLYWDNGLQVVKMPMALH